MNILDIDFQRNPYVIELETHSDQRGLLVTFATEDIPFTIQRIFTLSVNESNTARGGHAHKRCWQAILSIGNQLEIRTINEASDWQYFNISSGRCLILPPNNWSELIFTSNSSNALVVASELYDKEDYVYEIPHNKLTK